VLVKYLVESSEGYGSVVQIQSTTSLASEYSQWTLSFTMGRIVSTLYLSQANSKYLVGV